MMEQVNAPWTNEQVQNLKEFQIVQPLHPFTCGCKHGILLKPTNAGWVCPECGSTQNWAWDIMLDGSALANHKEIWKSMGRLPYISCSSTFPWDGNREFVLHPEAVVVADFGETVTYKCPHCKHSWTEELPE